MYKRQIIDKLHNRENCRDILLHIRNFHVADGSSWRKLLEFRFEFQLGECVNLLSNVNVIAAVSYTHLKTYTIRVRGINYRYENGANKKQEGEWSDAYTVTYKAADTSLKKISGVTASSYVLSWNPDKNADSYEIKITDEAGREYFESLASDRKSGRYTSCLLYTSSYISLHELNLLKLINK